MNRSTLADETSNYQEPAVDRLNIWFYWENIGSAVMPPYLRLCLETARRQCNSAIVHLVTPDNLPAYLPQISTNIQCIKTKDKTKPPVSLRSDYIRVKLLHEHGGLWIDIDSITLRDFSHEIFDLIQRYEFVGMRKTSKNPSYFTNSFMASRPGGLLISAYLTGMEALISAKSESGEPFRWTELGSDLLTETIQSVGEEVVKILPEKLIHPFDWNEASALQSSNPKVDIYDRIDDKTFCVMLYHSLFGDFIKTAPRSFIMNSDTLIGQGLRLALGKDSLPTLSVPPEVKPRKQFQLEDIAIVFTTLFRPDCCERLLSSVRNHLGPEPNIYFSIQGNEETRETYESLGTRYRAQPLFVAEDAGLSASRNQLVRHTSEPLILLCDDDFVMTERTRIDIALNIFNNRPDIKILGGIFENFYYTEDDTLQSQPVYTSFDHLIFEFNHAPHQMMLLPSQYVFPERHYIDHKHFFYFTDTVNNFALIDRAVFEEFGVWWDDSIKIMGEHEDFYMKVKTHDRHNELRVAYTNALEIEHHRFTNPNFTQKRSRTEGMVRSLQKWGLHTYVFFGKRVDTISRNGTYKRNNFPNWLKLR